MMVLDFLGRCMVSSLFIVSGVMKLQQYDYRDGGTLMDTVAPKLDTALEQIHSVTPKIPLSLEQMRAFYPQLLLVAIILELVGGITFILGASLGGYMLILFTVPVTLVMHDFWNDHDQEKQEIEIVQFMKNTVMVGALLCYLAKQAQVAALKRRLAKQTPAISASR